MWGMSRARLAIYLALIGVLVAVNLRTFELSDVLGPEAASGSRNITLDLPELQIRGEDINASVTRNLFAPQKEARPLPEPKPAPVIAPPPAPVLSARDRALAEADRLLEEFVVLGLLSASNGMVAVVEHDGSVLNLEVGQELIPGFKIASIDFERIVIINDTLDASRELLVGDPS